MTPKLPYPADPPNGDGRKGWTPLLEALPQGVILVDPRGRFLEVNHAAVRMLGLDREQLLSCVLPEPWSSGSAADGSVLPEEDLPGILTLRLGSPEPLRTLRWALEAGGILWLEVSAQPLQGGGALLSFSDITARLDQAGKLKRMKELYAALSQVNQAIVWSETRPALLDKICQAMVEFGHFAMAWIGWSDPETHEVRVLSRAGDQHGYLDTLLVRSDETPLGRGGTGTAIREGRTVVVNDFLGAQASGPWHGAA